MRTFGVKALNLRELKLIALGCVLHFKGSIGNSTKNLIITQIKTYRVYTIVTKRKISNHGGILHTLNYLYTCAIHPLYSESNEIPLISQ